MTQLVLSALVHGLLAALVWGVRERRRDRRARAMTAFGADGGTAVFRLLAEGSHPYPRAWTAGALVVHGSSVALHPDTGPARIVPLTRGPLRLRRVRHARPREALPAREEGRWCVVVVEDGAGRLLRLAVGHDEAPPLAGLLDAVGVVGEAAHPRTPRAALGADVPLWTVVVGVVGLLVTGLAALAWVVGERVDAVDRVVATDELPDLAILGAVVASGAALGALTHLLPRRARWRVWDRVPAWSVVVGAPGAVVMLLVLVAALVSTPVTTRVATGPDASGRCGITWVAPRDGTPQEAQVRCDVAVGTEVHAITPPAPWHGRVLAVARLLEAFAIGAVLFLVAAVGPVRRRRSARRRPVPRGPEWEALPEPALDLHLARPRGAELEVAVRRRADVERWAPGAPRVGALTRARALRGPWWAVPGLDRLALAVARPGWFVAPVLLVLALVVGGTSWGAWWGTRGPTGTAVVEDADEVRAGLPLAPGTRAVQFTTGTGQDVSTVVAWTGGEPQAPVTVQHALADPTRARVVGEGDGVPVGMAVSAALALGHPIWLAVRLVPTRRRARALREALADEGTEVAYLLTRDDDDDFTLLLLEGDRVRWTLPLADQGAGRLPVDGCAVLYGRLEPGACVVPVAAGRVWWPLSPLTEADEDWVRYLVTGEVPDEEPDLEDDPDRP
ncbi:hypothetical protein GCM10028777_23770 [Angustibacter speluncae]